MEEEKKKKEESQRSMMSTDRQEKEDRRKIFLLTGSSSPQPSYPAMKTKGGKGTQADQCKGRLEGGGHVPPHHITGPQAPSNSAPSHQPQGAYLAEQHVACKRLCPLALGLRGFLGGFLVRCGQGRKGPRQQRKRQGKAQMNGRKQDG